MAILNFPIGPTLGQVYIANGESWSWNGVSWVAANKVDVTAVVGILPIPNGGTDQLTASAAFNALAPVTTKGDLILGNGTNSSARLPIGLNGQVLNSDGITAFWGPGGGGGGMTYPAAGVARSTGVAWDTSLTVSGSGTVLALTNTPVLVTPNLGTPSVGNLINCTFPTLNQSTTGTAANVTGVVALANGGTGQTAKTAAFNALSPVTLAGDLILGNGVNSNTRLGIGGSGQVLTSNGVTAAWAAAAAPVWGTITGNLHSQTDLATVFVNLGDATLTTGVTSPADTVALLALTDTTLRIAPLLGGLFYSLIDTIGFPGAIKSFPQFDYNLSNAGLSADGIYIRFVSYDSTGTVILTDTDQRLASSNLQLGYIYLKRVSGVTTFLDGSAGPRNVITRPNSAGNNNYTRTFLNLATDVNILPNANTTVGNSSGNIYGENVNWSTAIPNQKGIGAAATTSFTTLNPSTAQSSAPPVFGTTVQTTQYWNGTAMVTVGANNWSVQRWMMTAAGTVSLQVGEAAYANQTAAQAAIDTAPFTVLFPGNNLAKEVIRLAAKSGCSNLQDTTQAVWQVSGAGGSGGGSSAAGTVTSVSVVSANGFGGTVATPTLTPAITLSTSVTGLVKGNGTALAVAVSGTDVKTVGSTSILGAGDIPFPASTKDTTAITGVLKGDGAIVTAAVSGTDLKTVGSTSILGAGDIPFPASTKDTTAVTGILKGDGTAVSAAISGTDLKTVGGVSIIGSGDIPTGGSMVYPAAGVPNSTGSAWGSSYSTTGSGTVLALATSPTLVTPVLGTPASGNLSNCTVDGTNQVGYRNIPQVIQGSVYTCVLTDAGKHILHPSSDTTARTFTIPNDTSVAYPIGTAITFINHNGAGVITIAIVSSNVMRLAGAGTTGNRTLAANGVATAVKLTTGPSAEWIISGTGLT